MHIFLLSHTDRNGCLRNADTKMFLSMDAARLFLGDRNVDGDKDGRWEVTEHSAKPGGRVYVLRHFRNVGGVSGSDAEIYSTMAAAQKAMKHSRHEAEGQWERRLGARCSLVEWDVDKDSTMACFGSDVESWKICEMTIPTADRESGISG